MIAHLTLAWRQGSERTVCLLVLRQRRRLLRRMMIRGIFDAALTNGLIAVSQKLVELGRFAAVLSVSRVEILAVDGEALVGLRSEIVPRNHTDVALMMILIIFIVCC